MTVYETTTRLSPAEVMEQARAFFARIRSPNAASVEAMGEAHLRLHLDMGEVVIGAFPGEQGTRVRGSASRGAGMVTRFLMTLPARAAAAAEPAGLGRAA